MAHDDLGGRAVIRLLLSVLADNRASSRPLEPAELEAARREWRGFIERHRDELRAGKMFTIGAPAITEQLFPPGFSWHHEGKAWPVRAQE